jgi:type IV pilus assembly protein PilM
MFGFRRKRKPMLGIDISSTAIKLIELSQATGSSTERYRVEAFAIESLPVNAVADNKIVDPDAVGQCIRRAVRRAGTKTKHAAVAVSGAAVITKVISMSAALSDAEMENQIQLEADQYIPYPLEEVSIDFNVLGPSPTSPDLVEVLLAASRRENVDDRVNALVIAGLTAVVVDVEAYAMENACRLILDGRVDGQSELPVAVVDVGAATMTLLVLHKGQVVYTREQNFGALQLIDEVRQRSGLPREQVSQKILNGDVGEDDEDAVLNPAKELLAQQISRALQFFYSGSAIRQVERVILAGGASGIPKIAERIEARIGLPTEVANPFANMSLSPRIKAQELMREASGMMVAIGLALRGFD